MAGRALDQLVDEGVLGAAQQVDRRRHGRNPRDSRVPLWGESNTSGRAGPAGPRLSSTPGRWRSRSASGSIASVRLVIASVRRYCCQIAFHVNRKRIVADYPRSMDMLRRLIAFDTTSRNSNLELIDFVRDHLDQLRHRQRTGAGRDRQEGQSLRHHRPRRPARHLPLRPHRRGADRRPGLVDRSLDHDRARRPAATAAAPAT